MFGDHFGVLLNILRCTFQQNDAKYEQYKSFKIYLSTVYCKTPISNQY